MSLFPAYASSKTVSDEIENSVDTANINEGQDTWLQNQSFIPSLSLMRSGSAGTSKPGSEVVTLDASDSEMYELCSKRKKKKHKKDKRSTEELLENNYGSKRTRTEEPTEKEESYFLDKTKEPSFYGMKRLTGPNVPRFTRAYFKPLGRSRGWHHYVKTKSKKLRYFTVAPQITEPVEEKEGEDESCFHDVQKELKKSTEVLNKSVSREPKDVHSWLKLVRLQPSLLALAPRDGPAILSPSERRSVTEKQIAILDRALHYNPSSAPLLRERYGLASTVVPGDILSTQLRTYLELQPCLVAGWLELVRLERSHLASCSVPSVTAVFANAMEAIHSRRKKELSLDVENYILDLVLACGVFLQEAGLQEQVWTMLRLYTEPSLPPCRDPDSIAELQATADQRAEALEEEAAFKEDELLASRLPSSELWLRIERLREAAHFLPSPDCIWAKEGDPQRLVYPEDLAHLAQPITQRSLALRVAVTALMVLGAPPIPSSHNVVNLLSPRTSMANLSLLATSWPLLAADVATSAGWLGEAAFDVASTSGAGTLNPGPGGELYRSLLHTAFHRYAACLTESEAIVLLTWWLRMETLLARLCQPDARRASQSRSAAKKLLKKVEFRGQTQLFREFALLEASLSRSPASAEKILLPSVLASRMGGPIVGRLADRATLCCVYRTLAELWLSQDLSSKAISLLCSLTEENCDPVAPHPPSEAVISSALSKYEHVTTEILATQNGEADLDIFEALSESFLVHWVSCYAWLLAATESVWTSGAMLERTIESLNSCASNTRGHAQKEGLFGAYISILELRGRKHPGGAALLRRIVSRAINEFPDNASFLAAQTKVTVPLGQEIKSYQTDQNLLGSIVHVLTLENRAQLQEIAEKEATQLEIELRCHPKVIAQYKRLITHYESRHCPLVWRLYLRYIGLRASPETIKSVFYKALEDCPWVKALYLQGASLLPEELSNIQDLLVEKELRLHVAPEELEILRSD